MPTLADVAKRAGVSLSTASYVLSGKRPISDQTRQRVLTAMDELGFQPNNQGRALASGKSRAIALLYPLKSSTASSMPLDFVTSAAAAAEARGYLMVLSTHENTEEHMLSLIGRGFVDGYILMEIGLRDARVELLRRRGLPFAMIGHCSENDGLHYVDLDFDHSVTTALRYLLEQGHRRISMITKMAGDPVNGYAPTIRCRRAFERLAVSTPLMGRIVECDMTPEAGFAALNEILDHDPETTAVLVINGETAAGVIGAVRERGLSIPSDLSVLGVLSARTAEQIVPPLTAVDFPAEAMGKLGVDFLINVLEGGAGQPQQYLFRPPITVRASTARAPEYARGT